MIALYKPYMPDLPELSSILYSGKLAYGPYCKRFEQALCRYFNTKYTLVTSSFNMAVFVVLETLGIKYGDEVIASPMACLASTQPFASSGVKIVWADVDPKTGTLCPESVKAKITRQTKAIIHNHFCGYPGHIDEINDVGRKNGIFVIDDGIESFGSRYKNSLVGACQSDVTIFSFNPVRIPNTIDGGSIIFKNKEFYLKSLLIRDCGIDRSRFRDELGEINPNCDITLAGQSATMSEVNGYIGLKQMETVETLLEKQQEMGSWWKNIFLDFPDITLLERKEIVPNYWVFGILANNKKQTISKFREHGFFASGVHINNNRYSIFGDKSSLPGVDDFYSRFVGVPSGWWVRQEMEQNCEKCL